MTSRWDLRFLTAQLIPRADWVTLQSTVKHTMELYQRSEEGWQPV